MLYPLSYRGIWDHYSRSETVGSISFDAIVEAHILSAHDSMTHPAYWSQSPSAQQAILSQQDCESVRLSQKAD